MRCSGNSYTPSPEGIDGLLWEVLSRVGVISVLGSQPGSPWEALPGCMKRWRYSEDRCLLKMENVVFFDISALL